MVPSPTLSASGQLTVKYRYLRAGILGQRYSWNWVDLLMSDGPGNCRRIARESPPTRREADPEQYQGGCGRWSHGGRPLEQGLSPSAGKARLLTQRQAN